MSQLLLIISPVVVIIQPILVGICRRYWRLYKKQGVLLSQSEARIDILEYDLHREREERWRLEEDRRANGKQCRCD